MRHNKVVIAVIATVVVVVGWAAFRPELLFINKRVNESFPGSAQNASMSGAAPVALSTG